MTWGTVYGTGLVCVPCLNWWCHGNMVIKLGLGFEVVERLRYVWSIIGCLHTYVLQTGHVMGARKSK